MTTPALIRLTIATLIGFALLIWLGQWQLQRLEWKERIIQRIETRTERKPVSLEQAVELAKQWRTDRALRRLEAVILVADRTTTLMISGTGDVIEPTDGVMAIGSGGNYALAAAQALLTHTDQPPVDICKNAMTIAGELCIYSNTQVTMVSL